MSLDDRVRSWLESNGFGRFAALFESGEIDGETLLELGEEHLKELGVPLGAPRSRTAPSSSRA